MSFLWCILVCECLAERVNVCVHMCELSVRVQRLMVGEGGGDLCVNWGGICLSLKHTLTGGEAKFEKASLDGEDAPHTSQEDKWGGKDTCTHSGLTAVVGGDLGLLQVIHHILLQCLAWPLRLR